MFTPTFTQGAHHSIWPNMRLQSADSSSSDTANDEGCATSELTMAAVHRSLWRIAVVGLCVTLLADIFRKLCLSFDDIDALLGIVNIPLANHVTRLTPSQVILLVVFLSLFTVLAVSSIIGARHDAPILPAALPDDYEKGSLPSGSDHDHAPPPHSSILSRSVSESDALRKSVLFGAVLLLFYLTDGSHDLSVQTSPRIYDRDLFFFVCLIVLAIAFLTLRPTSANTTSILNREQTEEWKGYMQIAFVLYHYFAAKEAYNLIRVFIACYVWLTGYGNFSYFITQKDYSFVRFFKIFVRLNFLVFFVALALDRDYMLYYVCPLHTFYFLTVYAHMAIFPSLNPSPFWMRLKFLVHFCLLVVLFEVPGVFQATWAPFAPLLSIENSLHEWHFRASLDHFACLAGMLAAHFFPTIEGHVTSLEERAPARTQVMVKVAIGVAASAVLIGWGVWAMTIDKYEYNRVHPYTSVVPIGAFVVLRNVSKTARGYVRRRDEGEVGI